MHPIQVKSNTTTASSPSHFTPHCIATASVPEDGVISVEMVKNTASHQNISPPSERGGSGEGASSSGVQDTPTVMPKSLSHEKSEGNQHRDEVGQNISDKGARNMPAVWDDIVITQSKSIAGIYEKVPL